MAPGQGDKARRKAPRQPATLLERLV